MEKEILEGNKLIAEFEGRINELCHHNNTSSPYDYDKSWDWLMPVVERIDSRTPYDPCVTIEYNWCSIKMLNGGFNIEVVGNSRIEATYKAVVDFIKWYNENNKTNDYAGINY